VTTILLPGPHDLFQLLLNDNRDILSNEAAQFCTFGVYEWLSGMDAEHPRSQGLLMIDGKKRAVADYVGPQVDCSRFLIKRAAEIGRASCRERVLTSV
jgi:hypothetical protein